DTFHGFAGEDHFNGGAGADVLDGGAGFDFAEYLFAAGPVTADLNNPANNTGEAAGDSYVSIEGLAGTRFDDVLRGNADFNILNGGPGADVLDGGSGSDMASYLFSATNVIADLADPGNNTNDAVGDIYISIENLRGSDFDDTLRGDGGNN